MRKILLAQCLATAALLTSCSLDLEPLDKLADQNYYNNRKELEVFTNGFYADFPTAENLYSETADIIIPTTLLPEVFGHEKCTTKRWRMGLETAGQHQQLSERLLAMWR